jgi:hypothetical protein
MPTITDLLTAPATQLQGVIGGVITDLETETGSAALALDAASTDRAVSRLPEIHDAIRQAKHALQAASCAVASVERHIAVDRLD